MRCAGPAYLLLLPLAFSCGEKEQEFTTFGPPSPKVEVDPTTRKVPASQIKKAAEYTRATLTEVSNVLNEDGKPAELVSRARGIVRIRAPRTSASLVRLKAAKASKETSKEDHATIAATFESHAASNKAIAERLVAFSKGADAALAKDIQALTTDLAGIFRAPK